MELIRKPKSDSDTGKLRMASRFGFLLPIVLVFLFSCSRATPDIPVVDGEATLKRLTLQNSGPLTLHGFWDFVPHAAPSSEAYQDARTISVPGTWSEELFSSQKDSVHRKGLYQLKLQLNSLDPFALRFTEVMTESCIYLEGRKVQCQGRTGKTEKDSVPNTTPFTVVLIPERLDPVLHIEVSNFHHRKGGIFGSVMVGTPAQIQTLDRNRMSRYLLVAGGLLLTALYFAVVGLFEGRAGTNLSLALFCFIALVRIMTAGEKPVASFFPGLPYGVYLRLQYITYFLSIAAALHYLYTMFPADVHRTMVRVVYAIAVLFSGFAVAANTTLLSYSLDYYAVVFFGVTFYCIYVISRASYYRRTGSYFIFAGMMALFLAVVVDFLRVYEVALIEYLVGDAILVLILCQAVATSLQNRNVHLKMGQLQTEKDLADAAARNNREFLSRMSHELRTPLHSIVHIGHLLKDEKDPARTADYVETLQSASDHLLTLVNDVLDFNRMVQGKLRYQEGSFSLGLLLNRVVVIHRERASGKGLDLKLEIDRSLPDRYLGDSHRIAQVMHNLIGNAIKFTYKGEIKVNVEPEIKESPGNGLIISVSDTGIGMSPDQIPQIFESYFQGSFQTDRKHEGTGLGLAISRELVRLMGGELKVQSEPGQGSTFSFTLPVIPDPDRYRTPEVEEISEAFAAAGNEVNDSRAFRQELVLIVDDNPDNRKLTGRFLEKWNLRYLEASSGTESLRILEGYYPHLILLDLHMPEMDGFATLAALRDKGYTGPIIAATADVSNETRLRLDAAGFDGFIGKPFSPAKFHQILSGYLNSRHLRNPASESGPPDE